MPDDASEAFRTALGARADTVHLVTYRTPDGDVEGMTATAVMALSLTPPSLLVSISHQARARDAIRESGAFGVSVLRQAHVEIAQSAGRAGGNKSFGAALTVESDPARTPVLVAALATFQCRVRETHDHFTHTLFLAEVLEARAGGEGEPLLHHRGGYVTVTELMVAPGARRPSE
jgi:flavin reductase (DIM6/NTAB) family NADH-FMN oxidoreductase RutF